MVNTTEIKNSNGIIRFIGSNRVAKYSPRIDHVALNFHVAHPNYNYSIIYLAIRLPLCYSLQFQWQK